MKSVAALIAIGVLVSSASRARADDDRAVAESVVKAIAAQDVAAFTHLVGDHLSLRDVWLASPECQSVAGTKDLAATEYPAFLRCAAALDLHVESAPSPRGDPTTITVLAFEPGGALRLLVSAGVVRVVGGLPAIASSRLTILGKALWANLASGPPRIEPDARVREAVAGNANAVAFAFLTVCVDEAGKVTRAQLGDRSDQFPTYVQAVQDAAARWTFKPFLHHGKPVPVCAYAPISYPADRAIPLPPPPPPPPRNIAPPVLEGLRIAGEKNIVPDAATKSAMMKAGRDQVTGSFKLCISTEGNISAVNVLKSSGFSAYDQKIQNTIRDEWRYRPYFGSGDKSQPVCTAVTFIYTQTAPPPPPQ